MLSLKGPFQVIQGVSVLTDHEDRMQYYVLPLVPRLTTRPDAAGRAVPQLQLIRFAGDTATGGFLNFDVDLGIPEEKLEAIREELRASYKLPAPPRLAPPPIVDGSVRLMLFGSESPPPPGPGEKPKPAPVVPATDAGAPQFVLRINQAAKPSLEGDERAAFSVALDQTGVEILDAALRGEMSPIGVVYSLSYVGLRPAYRVHVEADWDRVQQHLAEQTSVNSLIFSYEVDKLVDKLVEDRVIVIEADTYVAEGEEGGEAAASGKDEALDELKDMVLNTFFEPSVNPITESGSFVDGAKRVTQLLATAGIGSLFSRREVDTTRIDKKSLNATFSERTAVLRTIYPQGHLAGLLSAVEAGIDPSRFTVSVKTGDDFFKRRTVRVISRADWEADRIASINVALTYGRVTKNVVLDPTTAEQTVSWPSVMNGTVMVRDVSVSYTVGFKPAAGNGRPTTLHSVAETISGDAFEVFPRDLYEVMSVPINVVGFPWERYPTVELDLRYRDDANRIDQSQHYLLTEQVAAQTVSEQVFLVDRSHREVEYSLVLHGSDGGQVARPSVTTTDGLIRVTDPFPRRHVLTIAAPAAMFDTVERVYVDCSYDDGGKVQQTASYDFAADRALSQTFSIELDDPENHEVTFRATLVFRDGHVVELPESVTTEKRLLLRPDMKGHRSVAVRPEPVDFAKRNLREILVETLFEDREAQPALRFADSFTLQASTDRMRFEFDYVDPARDGYRYRLTHRYLNGLSKATGWRDSQATELVVPVQ
jgi:hypothetical protein